MLSWRAASCAVLLVAGLATPCDAAQAKATDAELKQAVNSLRGIRYDGLTDDQKRALVGKMDRAWSVLLADPGRSRPLVEAALDAEVKDGGFILDLCGLHLTMTKGASDPKRVTSWMLRADPNTNPYGYWKVAQYMAAKRCPECRPVLLQAAKLRALDDYIAEHALKVDLNLGLMLLWGAYGDELKPELEKLLRSADCAERGNAAFGLGFLRPYPDMGAVREMAVGDSCALARVRAWDGLAAAADPMSAAVANRRLAAPPSPTKEERWAMIQALTSTAAHAADAEAPLETLSHDSDTTIAADAQKGLDELQQVPAFLAVLRSKLGTGTGEQRARLVRALDEAADKGRFDLEASSDDMLPALKPEDLPAVHRARLSVLRRFSDECLYEYRALNGLLFMLRAASAEAIKPASP